MTYVWLALSALATLVLWEGTVNLRYYELSITQIVIVTLCFVFTGALTLHRAFTEYGKNL